VSGILISDTKYPAKGLEISNFFSQASTPSRAILSLEGTQVQMK
jgi:hypothetical protein